MNEMPSAYRETTRNARKVHKCCECCQPILPGEKYQYISGIWDHRPMSFKTRAACAEVRSEAATLDGVRYDEGPPFNGLGNWLVDSELHKEPWTWGVFRRLGQYGHESWEGWLAKHLPGGTEEGQPCGRDGCAGVIALTEAENCTCHLGHPPCHACTSIHLYCPVCGWKEE